MSKELNKAPVEQAELASCQGTNCGTTTGDHSSECLAEAAASQGWELKPGDLCGRDCPMRPAPVEQAGGDERAAFEAWLAQAMSKKFEPEFDLAKYEDSGEYRYSPAAAYWKAWQARAALPQPSPDHAVQAHDIPMLIASEHANPDYAMGWNDCRANLIGTPSPAQAEQAEAERPEVVARVVHSNPVVLDHCGPLNANDELMTVAQHAASVARWAEMFNRVEQERDAALARVAELEKQEPVAHLRASDLERLNQPGIAGSAGSLWNGPREGFVPLYAAPVAQAGQVPAGWYYDAPSQVEAVIIDIRGMWGEDDCPTYEDVAAALRRLLATAGDK
ncbi:hypothetical protein ACSEOK_26820 [Pseudomonas aeruginosa]